MPRRPARQARAAGAENQKPEDRIQESGFRRKRKGGSRKRGGAEGLKRKGAEEVRGRKPEAGGILPLLFDLAGGRPKPHNPNVTRPQPTMSAATFPDVSVVISPKFLRPHSGQNAGVNSAGNSTGCAPSLVAAQNLTKIGLTPSGYLLPSSQTLLIANTQILRIATRHQLIISTVNFRQRAEYFPVYAHTQRAIPMTHIVKRMIITAMDPTVMRCTPSR